MKNIVNLLAILGWASLASAQTPKGVSEADFLEEMPIVLSVSRLPQRLDETPGAVTLIDRNMIRLSGARDVADLMRLVPGFKSSASFESIAPQASYHGSFTSFSNELQVLVDGRSVYSPFFIGSTEPGLQTVALEDIERIEVLRGSNSAAYGARAMLGVINIVTRHTADTLGVAVGLSNGQNGIRDTRASLGWGQPEASFRIGVDRRADDGLAGANGHNEINRVNFRADVRPNAYDEIQLRVGGMGIDAGKGAALELFNPTRNSNYASNYAQLDWRRSMGPDEDLAFSISHGQETYKDAVAVVLGADTFEFNIAGQSISDVLTVQHTFRYDLDWRIVWGAEFRREQVISKGIYSTDAPFVTDFSRIFGNAEWRLSPSLLMNASAMAEKNSVYGDSLAPRLMLNWHVKDGQTFRAGVSQAFRPPATFENFSNVQARINGAFYQQLILSSGNLRNEKVLTRELGYLGDFSTLGLNLDVRVFQEQISDLITQTNTAIKNYVNTESFEVHGVEYQLKWRPWNGAHLIFNQAYTDNNSSEPNRALSAPKLASTMSLFQKLPGGLNLSLIHQDSSAVNLPGENSDHPFAMTRTDVRLSAPLRFGPNRSELALVVQNLGSPYSDFFPHFQFERRAFVTLRIEN
jgi:iron complex outermembrane receptor protein